MKSSPLRSALGWLVCLTGAAVASPTGDSAAAPRYGRDIRPLLSDRCFHCHGPDDGERQAGLRLDDFDEAVRSRDGVRAIVPGDPDASELWLRVSHPDPTERMPPRASHRAPLNPQELERVRRWIESGAEYEPHWAFEPPTRPPVPAVEARGPIDAFLHAALEERGIAPNPPAEPAALLRRVFLGLTGLPPTLDELDSFLADPAPDAYERIVDRLLTEEPYVSRYAEHAATPWLDAARYADTIGIHTDAGRQLWAWRDWVLRALRDGMPFDRFLTEQMAGDLLPEATLDQKVASGFHRSHVVTDEGGAIAEEYLVEYAVDRATTTATVFLGLTLDCARCHDHKFDPIDQDEFYSFYAYFNSVDEPGLYSQLPDPNRAFEPFLDLPSREQDASLARLEAELADAEQALAEPIPGETEERAEFLRGVLERTGLRWVDASVTDASSSGGAKLSVEADGSVFASGANPEVDTHIIALATDASDLRLVALEALADERLPQGRVGRAENGNAVLGAIRAEAISVRDPAVRRPVRFVWAWADLEQPNGDYRVVNALSAEDGRLGWAVDAHNRPGDRVALFLADEPFGYDGGTRLEVTLDYDSVYARHAFGRVRLSLASFDDSGLDALGVASSGWYATAPFAGSDGGEVFATDYGPETFPDLDTERSFDGLTFNFIPAFLDDRLNTELGGGINATYVAKRWFVPSARDVVVSLGTDDGFRLFLDGEEIAQREVDRGLAADQDRATIALTPGEHTLVLKVVNTGGEAGYYWRVVRREHELAGPLLAALLPAGAASDALDARLREAWLSELSPTYRGRSAEIERLKGELDAIRSGIPRTMVMRELDEPRPTFVLERGQYDRPDADRPVTRGVPSVLGALPEGAPADRRGLAAWMTSERQPLVARVAVNRLWAFVFGKGLVATSDDFGLQGAWPSHPELLDWLAVEYRESGWDTVALLRRLVTTDAFRRATRARPDLVAGDPENRLLARFPRRRLSAEVIRDQALYVSGLLVESFGGPSVKPLQPEGLWREVAMVASNTRDYVPGEGDDLWRRSVYTYWKRACPPPSMLAFDAPTREYCTVERVQTASPLQSLVLWNDPTFAASARRLADRVLDADGADEERLARLLRRCTGREPDDVEAAALLAALEGFRARYRADPHAALDLVEPTASRAPLALGVPAEAGPAADDVLAATHASADGERARPVDHWEIEHAVERAAWTLLATAALSLDATITQG